MKRIIVSAILFFYIISAVGCKNRKTTMFFSVKERINEIGIRKAIGADVTDIILQFVYEGGVYGFLSALVEIILSVLIDTIVYIALISMNIWNPQVAIIVKPETLLLVAVISIFISIISSIIPAIYASRIKVTEALRYD